LHISNACFLQTDGDLNFGYGSGVLSIELPSLTSVGGSFEVSDQADLTRVVLTMLLTVEETFWVADNPLLMYLSAPKIVSAGSFYVCGNKASGFKLPSSSAGTWPAKNPSITTTNEYSYCQFNDGADACNTDTPCTNFPWP
jgi:hypothetical protein